MKKASECRVGNKLIFQFASDQSPKIVTVSWVSDDSLGYYEQHEASYPQSPKSFTGIPLTPEILEKCGFEDIRGEYVIFNGICIYNDDERYFFADEDTHEGNINYFGNGFLYVHELQNLYFALTGEELNVSL